MALNANQLEEDREAQLGASGESYYDEDLHFNEDA